MKTPYLTKSRYIDGLRCEKKLWLGWHQRLPYEEALPFSVLDTGNRIGRGACFGSQMIPTSTRA